MIKLLGSIPKEIHVAVSGGVDSMALLWFLAQKHRVTALFFDHGTAASHAAGKFLSEYCNQQQLRLIKGGIQEKRAPKGLSQEEHWRNERYKFFESLGVPVVTAHHLDDVLETWLWSSCHGTPKLIPFSRGSVFRPLLLNEKKELISWCERKNIPWIEDESNQDTRFMRNLIRREMVPAALKVNPGIKTVLRKKLLERHALSENL